MTIEQADQIISWLRTLAVLGLLNIVCLALVVVVTAADR